MSLDYVRKLVSGKKARFVDAENAVNLDLVYGTDLLDWSLLDVLTVSDRPHHYVRSCHSHGYSLAAWAIPPLACPPCIATDVET